MGLTIHYRLRVSESFAAARHPLELVQALRKEATGLLFQEVGDVTHLHGSRSLDLRCAPEESRWLLIQAGQYVSPPGNSVMHYRIEPLEIIAFHTWPGDGCEEANIGLARYPSRIRTEEGRMLATRLRGWQWASFCKTQYANHPEAGGTLHFLKCHLTVIALLDAARRIGFDVKVGDDGGYWKTRDLQALVREVGDWDQFVASMGGALKDVLDVNGTGTALEAEIFRRPDFETLEARGAQDPSIAKVIDLIRKTTAA